MTALLLASQNLGKIREMEALLTEHGIELLTPVEIGLSLPIEETGNSYAENAAIKASAYAKATGFITLADDSGLEVGALGGSPGVHSARYSPLPNATDADRRAHLLSGLRGTKRPWGARFVCTVAIAAEPESIHYTQGICKGEIIPHERGQGGFGYDPLFYIPELKRTMAELTMVEKNQISHRARAINKAIPVIKKLLSR